MRRVVKLRTALTCVQLFRWYVFFLVEYTKIQQITEVKWIMNFLLTDVYYDLAVNAKKNRTVAH